MAFSSYLKGYWKFNGDLEDQVSLNNFSTSYVFNPEYYQFRIFDFNSLSYIRKKGLILKPNEDYIADSDSFYNSSTSSYVISVGFFYYSSSLLKNIQHEVTEEPYSVVVPVISKCNTNITNGIESAIFSQSEWCVTERYNSELDKNYIQVQLFDSSKTFILNSEPYDIGLHYVFFTVESKSDYLLSRIDIDGEFGYPVYIDDSSYLLSMNNTVSKISINKHYIDYSSHLYEPSDRYISDLTTKQYYSYNSFESINAIRFGVDFIANEEAEDTRYEFFSIPSKQPETVDTTSIFSEGLNIYVSRSNGAIHKGEKPIWDNYLSFGDKGVLDNIVTTNSQNDLVINSDGVVIKNNSIKL